jgi:hypothetical protein
MEARNIGTVEARGPDPPGGIWTQRLSVFAAGHSVLPSPGAVLTVPSMATVRP